MHRFGVADIRRFGSPVPRSNLIQCLSLVPIAGSGLPLGLPRSTPANDPDRLGGLTPTLVESRGFLKFPSRRRGGQAPFVA